MLCLRCNKNKVSTSKIFRIDPMTGLQEVVINTRCTQCKSKERQIESLQNHIIELHEKIMYIRTKLTETEYKLYKHIYG